VRRPPAVALATLVLLGTACGGGGGGAGSGAEGGSGAGRVTLSPVPSGSSPAGTAGPERVSVGLRTVATLDQPLAMAMRPGDDATLYVAEKTGRVVAVRDGSVGADPVLDLAGQVSEGGEQGLLGMAFSPDGAYLYVDFTDLNGDTHVTEYRMRGDVADPGSKRLVLFQRQPYANHNGGGLEFGPDGYLYVGLGDGGSGGDPHRNGQSLRTLLAKILRIDPRPSGGRPYGIPRDNPFVGRAGARPEIWAFGLRNPWRFSFDRETGDLWIGDVGQNAWEEIDRQPAGSRGGENYGWNVYEGTHLFVANPAVKRSAVTMPVYQYGHGHGECAVTGGYVYRGSAIPALRGAYVFADFCLGELMALRTVGGRIQAFRLGPTLPSLSSFGQDANGELYALSLNGELDRIVPA
jgi:glucose/arabinose dehydrogenase